MILIINFLVPYFEQFFFKNFAEAIHTIKSLKKNSGKHLEMTSKN